jgi:Tat protein secretion system quality control protein TatD with DNase activity
VQPALRLLPELGHQSEGIGREISAQELAGMMLKLQAMGCHNINLVSPSHVVAQIIAAVAIAADKGLRLPLVYNIRKHRNNIAAIGEVGLDYWWVKDPERRRVQRSLLEETAVLSTELDLPLNVHSRSAGHYTVDLLLAAGARWVLMHAFDGKASHAVRAAEAGYLFSVPPSVVRSDQKQKLVRRLPLESLALESDSPVLGEVREAHQEVKRCHQDIEAEGAAVQADRAKPGIVGGDKGRYPLPAGIDMVRYLLFKGSLRQAFLLGATIIGHRCRVPHSMNLTSHSE